MDNFANREICSHTPLAGAIFLVFMGIWCVFVNCRWRRARPSDTAVFMEFSWNRGILSRPMGMNLNRDRITPLPGIRESTCLVRFSSFRHTSAISAPLIKGVFEILARLPMSIGLVNGQALLPFVSSFGAANDYIGLEISDPMIEAALDNFNYHPHGKRISIQSSDLCRKAHRMALGPHDAPQRDEFGRPPLLAPKFESLAT